MYISVKRLIAKSALILMASLVLYTASPGAVPQKIRGAKRVVNGRVMAETAAGAGVGTLRNSPHEWGKGAGGFGKRFASGLGRHVLKTGIQAGVGGLHHEDLHYHRSNLHGTFPRLGYAVKTTFWVPRKNRPGHTVALGRLSGNMGSGLISRSWMPASAAGVGAGVASGGIGLGADVGVNVAKEFWPQHHKRRTARR
jgi:hypothetical protein